MNVTFTGMDAYVVAKATNRLPEVMDDGATSWRFARSLNEARAFAGRPEECIRLTAQARVLAEDLMKVGLDPETNPEVSIDQWIKDNPDHEVLRAAEILLQSMRT